MEGARLSLRFEDLHREDGAREAQSECDEGRGGEVELSEDSERQHEQQRTEERHGQRHVQHCAGPDFGTQQTPDAQLQANGEQENRDSEIGDSLELGRRAVAGRVQAKAGKQEADQGR